MMDYSSDKRIVMTLDAGGTNFVFSAFQANKEMLEPIISPSNAHDLDTCLDTIVAGFTEVLERLDQAPVAISFAFPGPADYVHGVIGELGNLPAFDRPVALGSMLEEHFNLPVYINNDGDLFVYGEALAGLLPHINAQLEAFGSGKRYENLFGVTLGTGFGGGFVHGDTLYRGDNSAASEIWLMRNKLRENMGAEEEVSVRGVRRTYAAETGISFEEAPEPVEIAQIAGREMAVGYRPAGKAFAKFGRVLGDALANAVTLLDAPVVIGGGLAQAHSLFLPEAIEEMNRVFETRNGRTHNRLVSMVYNLEALQDFEEFCHAKLEEVSVPHSEQTTPYNAEKKIGVGITILGTAQAISVGAYNFALHMLDRQQKT